jgi:hypothetical protein
MSKGLPRFFDRYAHAPTMPSATNAPNPHPGVIEGELIDPEPKGLPRFDFKRAPKRARGSIEVVERCAVCGMPGQRRVALRDAVLCPTCYRRYAIGAGLELLVGGIFR